MRYEDLVYHKGDIYIAELGENFGHEQSGTRPVIIMQNDVGNYFSPTVTIVPLTSKDKKPGQPTHYRLDMKNIRFSHRLPRPFVNRPGRWISGC